MEKKRPAETPIGGSQQPHEDKKPRNSGSGYEVARARKNRYNKYHELTASIEKIFVNYRSEVDFRPPIPIKGKILEKHKDKLSLFHNVNG